MGKSSDGFPSIAKQGFVYGVFRDLNYVMHAHANIELICLMEGSLSATIEGRHYTLNPGDMMAICSNQFHSYRTPESSKVLSFGFRPDVIPFYDRLLAGKVVNPPVLRRGDYPQVMVEWMDLLLQSAPMSSGTLRELGILLAMLGMVIQEHPPVPAVFEDTLERRLIVYVTKNCYEPISLQDVAAHFALSQSVASRLIARVFDMGLNECVRTMRMNTAKRMLSMSGSSIPQIAAACGYDSVRTFNRAFATETETTPSAYRRSHAYSRRFDETPLLPREIKWE